MATPSSLGELARPIWRSMLFVPAHVDKFVARAHERGADAVILDLEDSVPLAQKAQAREALAVRAAAVAGRGTTVLVRVNADAAMATQDIDAAVGAFVRAIVLPKIDTPRQVLAAARQVEACEQRLGLRAGHTWLIAQIEDVSALPHLDAIATSSPRLLGMILGSEDFCASAGMVPTPATLFLPNQMVAFACRRAGILPLGFPTSIAEFSDLQAFALQIGLARDLGFVGAFCIHPAQVPVLNEGFSPSARLLAYAEGVVIAFETAQREGRGAIEFAGKMVDLPVVLRSRELLRRAAVILNPTNQSPGERSS
jgi:citrate lyase subunit beta/citryl-CoA lyase